MTEQESAEISLIDVVPSAGAMLNCGTTWRDQTWIADSIDELGELVSTVSSAEMTLFLREEHRNVYGRPWAVGHYYEEYLTARGVGGKDRILDFGCGAGRIGARLIEQLPIQGYVGVDSHLLSLKAFASYEIPLRGVEDREPVLVWGGVESLRFFQPDFSVILDLFTSVHMPDEIRQRYFDEARRLLRPGGRLISLSTGSDVARIAKASGWMVTHKHMQDLPLLWPLHRKKRYNSWVEYSVIEP